MQFVNRFKDEYPTTWRYLCYVPNLDSKTRNWIWLAIGPLIASFVLLHDFDGNDKARKAAFVTVWIAFYWMTEPLPIAATALLPVVLFPLLSIATAKEISSQYLNDTLFLMLGSFIFAAAMERWNLHKKLAISFLLLIGERPKLLILGFMSITAFISMWISNTATTSMMTPLALAVLFQLQSASQSPPTSPATAVRHASTRADRQESSDADDSDAIPLEHDDESPSVRGSSELSSFYGQPTQAEQEQLAQEVERYSCGTLLGIAYSASIGGTATLIGTGPNVIFASFFSKFTQATPISFAQWSSFAVPLAVVMILAAWGIIVYMYARNARITIHREALIEQNDQLGPLSFAQGVLLVVLVIMVILWGFRSLIEESGIFGHGYVTDGTVSMLIGTLLFFIPHRSPRPTESKEEHSNRLVDGSSIHVLHWDIILLMGGGMALADGFAKSGLSAYMTHHLRSLGDFPPYLMLILICCLILFITELTSNVATITLALPILASMAVTVGQNPLLLMVPGTICSSFAFMLPVATPPNAIVFASRHVKVADMAKTGLLLNILGVFLVPTLMISLGQPVFGVTLGVVPSWAGSNSTAPI